MPKVIILGAGASKACPNTDPNRPMPLLRDLPGILNHFDPPSGFHLLGEYLNRLLAVTSGNIEELLTFMYRLNESFFMPRGQYLLDAKWIDQILASSALPEVFVDPRETPVAIAVVEVLRKVASEEPQSGARTFSPGNFFTTFQGALREYFSASIRTHPCPLHMRLFQDLNRNDCVASFNYDDIADHSLFAARKLTPFSFQGLGFEEILLPARPISTEPLAIPGWQQRQQVIDTFNSVKFLKVHGSFTWWCCLKKMSDGQDGTIPVSSMSFLRQSPKGGLMVRYSLGDRDDATNWDGWTFPPIIFPFLVKGSIYRENAIFARHLAAFQNNLRWAEEIFLVGKSFQNSDHELNGMIRWATFGDTRKVLHIVDPSKDSEFESFHCALFNARLGRRYASFEEYVNHSVSIRS